MDIRFLNACKGKSESNGGLNINDFREQLSLRYPTYTGQIQIMNRSELNELCHQLTSNVPTPISVKSSKEPAVPKPISGKSPKGPSVPKSISVKSRKGPAFLKKKSYINPIKLLDKGQYDTLKSYILDGTIDINKPLRDTDTILNNLIMYNLPDFVEWALEHGADVNGLGRGHITALMLASEYSRPNVVQMLLKHGANPNLQDVTDNTALHYNFFGNPSYEIIELLLQYGADPNIKNRRRESAIDLINGDEELTALINQYQ
jgi:hypothetical protein